MTVSPLRSALALRERIDFALPPVAINAGIGPAAFIQEDSAATAIVPAGAPVPQRKRRSMTKINIVYTGNLRCRATHEDSQVEIGTDAPVDNQGEGSSFSPSDLVATGLGTCMATIMGIVARRHEYPIEGMKVTVIKEMTKETPRRIRRLTTEIWLPIPKARDPNRLLERAAMTCPVHHSLHPDVEKPVVFHWREEEGEA